MLAVLDLSDGMCFWCLFVVVCLLFLIISASGVLHRQEAPKAKSADLVVIMACPLQSFLPQDLNSQRKEVTWSFFFWTLA